MNDRYDPGSFEEKWMKRWDEDTAYAAADKPGPNKRFIMEMFPYPSGDLHMGHVENYSIADAQARYWRMTGHEVMHPMGYDAFGLPAENAAIAHNAHPRDWTANNIAQMRSSFKRLGCSYDWDREVISSDPGYYRWNQWIFLKFYERGLAYRKEAKVFWCPVDKTVLANEQLSTGVCWRCGSEPEVRDLVQWFLKITDYSDRLLDEMEGLKWSESILSQQRHWIGRSRGADVVFKVRSTTNEATLDVPVFTTRPDTLWGATFFVFAPEHPDVPKFLEGSKEAPAFEAFLNDVRMRSEVERQKSGDRTGFRLPAVAVNPVDGEEIEVWAADYVMMSYGTGAIMAVPAHDQRDFEFARQNAIPIRVVVQPEGKTLQPDDLEAAAPGTGVLKNSGPFDGTRVDPETGEGIQDVIGWLEKEGKGKGTINYRQRDWLVSRQRYWGTPIPIIYCSECGEVTVPYEDLPVVLPDEVDYEADIEAASPLAANEEWVDVPCPNCGHDAKRETDTLDTFFDSSWYFLRYCDPHNTEQPFDPEKVRAWLPVDQYVGGVEHAVMHLIYARFFVKIFQDMGLLDFPEPFLSLFNQGSISLGGAEMSSSKGNAIDAHDVFDRFGADSARVFILFCSPPDAAYDFAVDGMEEIGRVAHSWLSRVWRIVGDVSDDAPSDALTVALNRTIKGVTEDMGSMGFNTAIAKLMELVNDFSKLEGAVPRVAAETFLKLLAPIAPFIAEEMWAVMGHDTSIHGEAWPAWDDKVVSSQRVTMVVQVGGKVRDRIEVEPNITEEAMKELAFASQKAQAFLNGEPKKVIVVPPKLVNLVP